MQNGATACSCVSILIVPRRVFFGGHANDPIKLSQAYLLEQQGWMGILIDPVPACCDALRQVRTRNHVFQNALGDPQHRSNPTSCPLLRRIGPTALSSFMRRLALLAGATFPDPLYENAKLRAQDLRLIHIIIFHLTP